MTEPPRAESPEAQPGVLWRSAGESLDRTSKRLGRGAVAAIGGGVCLVALMAVVVAVVALLPEEDQHANARPFPPGADVIETGMTVDIRPIPFAILAPADGDIDALWAETIAHYESLGWSTSEAAPRWVGSETDGTKGFWVAVRGDDGSEDVISMDLHREGRSEIVDGPFIYIEVSK